MLLDFKKDPLIFTPKIDQSQDTQFQFECLGLVIPWRIW